ncbi:MAG: hypothetical protein QM778_00355 [Myxococcales bacterium]
MASLDELKQWIERDVQPRRWRIEITNESSGEVTFHFTGRSHIFIVSASVANDYLGCTCRTHFNVPGKGHPQFADLADGKLAEQTWQAILTDMKQMELQPYRGPGL